MNKFQVPENESERLEELDSYSIIGDMEDYDFDFLTSMASQICGTKISLISFITDKKQWFLSHKGLDLRETPKEFAFCAHAINKPEDVFVVEDSRTDDRFRDNPLVTGDPHVVFYTGVPLVNEKGFPLGTLCVIDDQPKKLNAQQLESLKMLSRQVIHLLELRKKTKSLSKINAALSKTTALFNQSQRINKIGAWETDLTTGITSWTEEVFSIYEVGPEFDYNKVDRIEFYHPDDRPLIREAVEKTIATKEPFDITCRLFPVKGTMKWIRTTGIFWEEADANPKLMGSIQDVSEVKNAEKEILDLLELTQNQNERLKNFAHIVSHNLRSHSGGISMLLELFKMENPEIYAKELFQHIKNSSDNLSETIKHLTEVVQINLGAKQKLVPIALREVIQKNISSLLPLAQKAGVVLQNDVPANIKVMALPAYLESIVLNMLSNGIKYSSRERAGFVQIGVEIVEKFVVLVFKDNGLGIDLKMHGHKLFGIYKTFHKHEDSRGVGLYITKNQIEAMGGRVEVESEVNKGTTFKIFLQNEKN